VKVDTKGLGLIEVDERQKVIFPQGLFGFENFKDYVLLDAEQEPFYWLQSVEEKKIAFIILDPFLFRADYEIKIENEDLSDLGIDSPEKALIFAIVTIPEDGPITANLQGPLIINKDTMTGKQAVINDPRWHTKHDLMAELAGSGK